MNRDLDEIVAGLDPIQRQLLARATGWRTEEYHVTLGEVDAFKALVELGVWEVVLDRTPGYRMTEFGYDLSRACYELWQASLSGSCA